jgi:MHS family proline/betaine transporter-like MFS transporter
MIAGVIGAVSLLVIREPNGTSMWGSPPAAASEAEAHDLVQSPGASHASTGLGIALPVVPTPRQII